jgi:hypothetical protein
MPDDAMVSDSPADSMADEADIVQFGIVLFGFGLLNRGEARFEVVAVVGSGRSQKCASQRNEERASPPPAAVSVRNTDSKVTQHARLVRWP